MRAARLTQVGPDIDPWSSQNAVAPGAALKEIVPGAAVQRVIAATRGDVVHQGKGRNGLRTIRAEHEIAGRSRRDIRQGDSVPFRFPVRRIVEKVEVGDLQ